MENASNALLIAAGVLIGIMVLSIAVFLFADFSSTSRDVQASITANQLQEFNAQFNIYANRNDLTIYDVISIANLAKQNNEQYSASNVFETEYKVIVNFKQYYNFQDEDIDKYQSLIQTYNEVYNQGESIPNGKEAGDLKDTFNIGDIVYNSINGRVKTITIKHN